MTMRVPMSISSFAGGQAHKRGRQAGASARTKHRVAKGAS